MSINDMECPYCGEECEVCHDDGAGYAEDVSHEQQCWKCEKYFVFHTSIHFTYRPKKADCLNDSPHQLRRTNTYPPQYARMQCQGCEYSKDLPKGEFERLQHEYEATNDK